MIDAQQAKPAAEKQIKAAESELIALSHEIHAHPEVAFEEESAARWLSQHLADAGFDVDEAAYELPTAFAAKTGTGPLHIVLCAEYDALPSLGHACGHNIIATMSLGAAMALAPLADDLGLRITVLGTPGEEVCDGGGKILLLERGAFDDVHAAMMLHPWPTDQAACSTLASTIFDAHYRGTAAHAAAFPHQGINAGAALTIAETAIAHLRMHLRPTEFVNGIITSGGTAPNIVPDHTSARYLVRGSTLEELAEVKRRALCCFQAGALATGCTLEIVGGEKPYADFLLDPDLTRIYQQNAETLGRRFAHHPPGVFDGIGGSTDMGNVSQVVPAIHPMIGLHAGGAVNHQPEYAAACVTPQADDLLVEGATLLAHTIIDTALDPNLCSRLLTRTR